MVRRWLSLATDSALTPFPVGPVLGPRLSECTRLVNLVDGCTNNQIFGYPDDLKFRSSMTLFDRISPEDQIFRDALQKYFGGEPDRVTLERL